MAQFKNELTPTNILHGEVLSPTQYNGAPARLRDRVEARSHTVVVREQAERHRIIKSAEERERAAERAILAHDIHVAEVSIDHKTYMETAEVRYIKAVDAKEEAEDWLKQRRRERAQLRKKLGLGG